MVALALALVFLGCRQRASSEVLAALADVLLLWGLAAVVTLFGDQTTEVALCFFAASVARLVAGPWRGLRDSTRFLPDAAHNLAVAALAVASLGLVAARRDRDHIGGGLGEFVEDIAVEEWAATAAAVGAFALPLGTLASVSVGSLFDSLFLRVELEQGSLTAAKLKDFETAALVIVRCYGLAAAKGRIPRDANPRLLITAVTPSGLPLVRSSGQTNSRVLALDTRDMQPAAAHCLTYAIHDHDGGVTLRSMACFKVEVLDTTGAGVDRVVAEGTFRMNLAAETEATVSVPLRRTAHASKRHADGSCVISCSYTIPGELLASRKRFARSPLLHAMCARPAGRLLVDHFLEPKALAQYSAAPDRLPHDHSLLHAAMQYLSPSMEAVCREGAAAAVVVEDMDPRFLDLLVAEAESENHRKALIAFLAALCDAADPAKALPLDGPFVVDWLSKCSDPALLDAALDLFGLVGGSGAARNNAPRMHSGKRPDEHKVEIEQALHHRKAQHDSRQESRARAAKAELTERRAGKQRLREKKVAAVASARQFAAAHTPVPGNVPLESVELQTARAPRPAPQAPGVAEAEAQGWAQLESTITGFFEDAAKLLDPANAAPLPPPNDHAPLQPPAEHHFR